MEHRQNGDAAVENRFSIGAGDCLPDLGLIGSRLSAPVGPGVLYGMYAWQQVESVQMSAVSP